MYIPNIPHARTCMAYQHGTLIKVTDGRVEIKFCQVSEISEIAGWFKVNH